MPNSNYDEILSTTFANHRDAFIQSIFSRRVLAFHLRQNDRIKMKKGGHKIVLPVLLTKSSGGSSYQGTDTMSLSSSNTGTAAEYTWKQYQQPITIDGITEFKNSGDSEIIDLLEAKVDQAEETTVEDLNAMWFGDGTGNGGKDMNGLKLLIGDQTDAIPVVGNIDSTTEPKWRSNVTRTAGAFSTAVAGTTVNGINKLRTAINTTRYGNDSVDLIITDQTVFESFEAQLNLLTRYEDTDKANAGFANFTYKNIPVVFDEQLPTAFLMYGVNSKHLYLVGGEGRWFYTTPFETTPDKDAKWAHILTYGNMVCDNRRTQFRIEFSGA